MSISVHAINQAKDKALYNIRIRLIKDSIRVGWVILVGLVLMLILKPVNYTTLILGLIIFSVAFITFTGLLSWESILKKERNINIATIITVIILAIVSSFNYLLHSNRLFPFILLIIFAALFYEAKRYWALSLLTVLGLSISMAGLTPHDVLFIEIVGFLIFTYFSFEIAKAYKKEMVDNFIKSRELAEKVTELEVTNKAIKQKDAEKKQLLKQLMSVQESERKRIAHELHDDIGQTLSGLLITLKMAYKKVSDDQVKDTLEVAINEFQGTVGEIDRIIWSLRPTVLDDLGLVPALRSLAKRYTDRMDIDVRFESELNMDMPEDVEVALYRIAQEALNNIVKHANASKADIELEGSRQTVEMKIADDGKGFKIDDSNIDNSAGLGLKGMRERLAMLKGELIMDSSSAGTTLKAVIPLNGG